MSGVLQQGHAVASRMAQPMHPRFPIAALDLFGAMRLSSVVNWMATGVFDPPGTTPRAAGPGSRASALQEVAGIMIVVFGGETFLSMCTGATPSWMLTPNIVSLFSLVHLLQTRTPLRALLPRKPTLALELALAVPDAIGRTLLLTRFSIVPLLHPTSPKTLPATPATLILVPFILAVPFAAIAFTGANLFAPLPFLSTPAELRPYGWTAVDAWLPLAVPALFLELVGPVPGWPWGRGLHMREEEAVMVCMAVTSITFLCRAWWNFGRSSKAIKKSGKKSKTQ